MPSLRDTQLAFASCVLGEDAKGAQGMIIECGFSTEERMRVYRNNARIGFHAALRAAFPVIEQLGAADWFETVAQHYQRKHPSRSGDLQYAGERFAQFLQVELAGTAFEWFADVARLEWAYQETLVAPESAPLDITALAELTLAQHECVVLVPRTELRLLQSRVPVLSIWKAHQLGSEVQDFSLDEADHHVLLLRRATHVELRELPLEQAVLLDAFLRGDSLLTASQQLMARLPEADLGHALRRLVQLETLTAIRIPHH